ncbi:hypothetical protein DTQ70_09040 [Runella sp. SP2]|nr:hypothetical protein DTQ70_09040 [Runella sp. SP2]
MIFIELKCSKIVPSMFQMFHFLVVFPISTFLFHFFLKSVETRVFVNHRKTQYNFYVTSICR